MRTPTMKERAKVIAEYLAECAPEEWETRLTDIFETIYSEGRVNGFVTHLENEDL